MRSTLLLLSIILASPISFSIAEDRENSHTKTIDSAGTTTTTETSHQDSMDAKGNTESSQEVTTIVDPKGMLNEKSVSKHSEQKRGPNGDFSESDTVTHADGTEVNVTADKRTNKHWTNKGKTTTSTHTRSVDPKGLGNEHDVEVKETIDSNDDGTTKRTVTKKIDGKTVSKEMNVTH